MGALAHKQEDARRPQVLVHAETMLKARGYEGRVYSVDAEGRQDVVLFVTPEGKPRTAYVRRDPTSRQLFVSVADGWA